ncbi:MAG: hypothetical protein RL488_399 [Actinomycetota bacterium]
MKTTFRRKALAGTTAALAAFALLGTGIAPAQAADAHGVFLSFEEADNGKVTALGGAGTFSGTTASLIDSTHLTGKALQIAKGGDPWSGVNLFLVDTLAYRMTDATHKVITMDYFSPDSVASPVMMKLTAVGGAFAAKTVEAQPGVNHLEFDMSTGTGWSDATEYKIVTVFPDFGADDSAYSGAGRVENTGQLYEMDNISFNGGTIADVIAAPPVPRVAASTVLTFEDSDTLGALAAGNADANKPQGGFEGLGTSIEAAPAGGNGGKALKMVKGQGAATYAGVNLVKFTADTRITDDAHKVITMNYYSAKADSKVRLEVRPWPAPVGVTVTATKVGWQTLTFDFTGAADWSANTEFADLTLFPDFDVAGANTTYYVDNIAFNGGVTPSLPAPVTKPVVRVAASVAGTAKVGKTLTAGKGSWTGASITYTYKWYRCTVVAKTTSAAAPAAAAKCSVISGATTASHKVVTADVGKYLRVLVTARNSAGSVLSLSKSTTAKATK